MNKQLNLLLTELKHHSPFTLFGAATGIMCMLLFKNFGTELHTRMFQVFHPTHVILSAIVTASLFRLHKKKTSIITLIIIGYFGSVGIATLSDCVLPFFGESLLGVAISVHGHSHEHENQVGQQHEHEVADSNSHLDEHVHEHEHKGPEIHLGFIEEWYLVNPAAILGILIAYFLPRTKFPHAGHVLISTWASSFHVLMNTGRDFTALMWIGMLVVLFIAVWLPCCVSDIVFPMLFVKSDEEIQQIHH